MRKFGVFSCGTNEQGRCLQYEVLWTPRLIARFEGHNWLRNTSWRTFVETAEVGDVFDGLGVYRVVRLRELPSDFED